MKRSTAYRKAAVAIAEGKYTSCCEAIKWESNIDYRLFRNTPELELFAPIPPEHPYGHFIGFVFWWDTHDRGSRILALLFCELMAKETGN